MINQQDYEDLIESREWGSYDQFDLPCPNCESDHVSLCTCYGPEDEGAPKGEIVGRFKCAACDWSLPDMEGDCQNCQSIEAITNLYLMLLRNEDKD